MGKHFLATIGNDTEHLFGVRFVCSFLKELSQYQVTLLHICKSGSTNKAAPISTMWDGPSDKSDNQIPVEVSKSINKAKDIFRSHNIPVEKVFIKSVSEQYGKVKDILTESSKGLYDAIILGRRASYALQWMFDRPADETFIAMVKDSSCVSPLWICPDLELNRKNVLLCIDGSENCYRAVDHVGYILSDQEQHSITLFHVENSAGKEGEKFFSRAEKILQQHNISNKNISRKTAWGLSISSAIESEAQKGKYAVVAIGMGESKNNLASKTTAKLITKIEKVSLWCCP